MNNYYTFPGTTIPNYAAREQTLKNIIDQANRELAIIQNPQYPAGLTQNFQITPAQTGIPFKIVNNLDDVNKEIVLNDTYFMSNNYDMLWIKNPKGELRTFHLNEEVKKDEKDLLIEDLQNQINELKRGMNNVYDKYDGTNGYTKINDAAATNKSTNVQSGSASISKKRQSQ